MQIKNIETAEQYQNIVSSENVSVILYSADWAEQCQQVKSALVELSKLVGEQLQFAVLEAENFPEISMKHQIEAVPTVIFFKKNNALDRVDGVNIAAVSEKCKILAANDSKTKGVTLEERLKNLINKAPLMIFMKGNREAPRCGFSKQIIEIVNSLGLSYETFDILTDEEIRQGLKTYSDWPTYPQVYVKGELIGGLDIIKELQANGELKESLSG